MDAVRIVGGPYNGFEGHIAKRCDQWCSVVVEYEGEKSELVLETKFVIPLKQWEDSKTETELALRGHTI